MDWCRKVAVAGRFYPGDKATLREELQGFFAVKCHRKKAIAVVAPHAGYVYSGRFAGEVFRRVEIP